MRTMKMHTFRSLILVLGLTGLAGWPACQASAQDRQILDEIVALVDEGIILRSELDQMIETISRQVETRGERLPPRPMLEEQVLERLIMQRLQVMRAERTGIRVSDQQVDRALADVAAQNRMTLAELRAAIESDGFDFGEFRNEIRQELIASELRQRIVDSMDEPTETEIEILLTSDQFGGDEFHLSQILIVVPESASPAEARQAEERAAEVWNQLRDGLDFSSAAISYSQAPDALEGGEIGWRNLNTLPRQFADMITNLGPGEVSRPIRTNAGLVIIRVNDRRARGEVIVREFRARHLMVEPDELITPEQARSRIEDTHRRLVEGESFDELARRWSSDESSANLGGLLPWFPEGAYGPMFQSVFDSLEPGQFSQPFQSPSAWHIVQLEEVRQADRTTDTIRAEARDILMRQRADQEIERFLRQMRSEAFVESRL